MEKYVTIAGIALAASLVLGLMGVLVGHVLKMWREAKKEQKDMGRLKAGSVWRMRSDIIRNDPFAEEARHFVLVLGKKANSDGRMWVRYQHKSGLVETDPADVFVHLYRYVEEQDLLIMANAGEVVLNASQQQNLARQLQQIDMGGDMQPCVSGEMIQLGISNYAKRSGKGKVGNKI